MTGKLLKHDLRDGALVMGHIYLAAAIAIAAMIGAALTKPSDLVKFLLSLVIVVITFVAVIVTFVSVVFGANKKLFGREGYLTLTLPVRTSSLIFSKWLAATVWVIISYALVAMAFVGVYIFWTSENEHGAEIYDMLTQFAQSFGFGAEKVYTQYFIVNATIGLFNACIFVMFVLFAITLSNIRPFSSLGSFGVILYLAVAIIGVQVAGNALANLCDITMVIQESGISMAIDTGYINEAVFNGGMTIGFTSVYFKAIITVFVYILTVQLVDSKVNLK